MEIKILSRKTHSFSTARAYWEKARTSTDYTDVHNWRFTSSSFRLMLADLQALGLTELGIAKEFYTDGCEFFVAFRKTSATVAPDRLELLNGVSVDG